MSDAPKRLGLKDLREIVADSGELTKGSSLYDAGALSHLSRYGNKLFADAKGSGASPYKVQLVFDERIRGRCSCMAARSRPFCKHAAALLVAWARAPESFAVADAPPKGAPGETKRKSVKKGKVDAKQLMTKGVEQMSTLVRELAVSGVASLGSERAEQVRGLSEALRENRLRRLSARAIALSELCARSGSELFDAAEYAELFGDTVLTVRKLEKHLGGEPLDDKHVEELIGKTWTKKDRKPVTGLSLLEYAFVSRVTPDDFVIRESRFVDLNGGEHWSEKQILPGFLAKRTDPKRSFAGHILHQASGSVYPSFAPYRLELSDTGQPEELGPESLSPLLDKSFDSVGAALKAFQEHKKDVFAPDTFPVAVRVDTLIAQGRRTLVADAAGAAFFLPEEPGLEEQVAGALKDARLCGLLGDVMLDGALPTLVPLAAVLETRWGQSLRPVVGVDAAQILASRKVKLPEPGSARHSTGWVHTARAAGASPAAIALGEVREELAELLVGGLSTLMPRATDALSARLRELGLEKPAALLDGVARRDDASDKIDDFVKVHQVLGIALTRLAGAARVDRSALVAVPPYESVHVTRREERISPREIAARIGRGELHRFESALLYAAWYEGMSPDELVSSVYPTWADGSAAPFIARAVAGRGEQAVAAARRALEIEHPREVNRYWYQPAARMAKLTALRVLGSVGSSEAEELLEQVARDPKQRWVGRGDATVRAIARRLLSEIRSRRGEMPPRGERKAKVRFDALRQRLLTASDRHDRIAAIREIADKGLIDGIPYLRASFAGDVSREVREAAAYALADLGDADSLDAFVRQLRARHENPSEAKVAASALGALGDVRGLEELLDAWEEVWQPGIVSESMRQIGTAALAPLVARLEARPDLTKRTAALNVLAALSEREVTSYFLARMTEVAGSESFVAIATTLIAAAKTQPATLRTCAAKVLELAPDLAEKQASKEAKALARKCQKALA